MLDRTLLAFRMTRGEYGEVDVALLDFDAASAHLLPLSFGGVASAQALDDWLRRRRVPKNRAYVDEILRSCGIESDDVKSIIDVSRGLSLNDAYWVVPGGSRAVFDEWNLYENDLNEALQLAAYTGVVSDALASGGLPSELTNGGMFPKAWRAVGGKRFLYKAGHLFEGANMGKEPYSEHLAWQVAQRMGIDAVAYDLTIWKGALCSTCENFCSKGTAFAPLGFAMPAEEFRRTDLRSALGFYAQMGEPALESFKSMLVFDALVFNEDRHMGNYGVLRDAATGHVLGMAPVFDNNLSLFASAMPDEFEPDGMLERAKRGRGAFAPALDEQAALVMGPVQKRQLERLAGFELRRHPVMDEFPEPRTRNHFSDERLRALNEYLRRRADQMLSLPTVDPEKILRDVSR
ncbi:XRE family transcriptional regulator [Adlercreutzia sp. ZJ473]|uniref:XRE family transcriptional regulator n=1 Tax=Adlercreutzia sp. ZJ473 TaxID=2722822 RepID=UPI001554F64F|nr:XRE family transcriptional regulator [Adlercreutzia sp. ZJ473]